MFGPTREEVELSTNGKRLRIKKDSLRRPGGCFVNGNEETSHERNLEHSSGEAQALESERSELEKFQTNEEVVMFSEPSEKAMGSLEA